MVLRSHKPLCGMTSKCAGFGARTASHTMIRAGGTLNNHCVPAVTRVVEILTVSAIACAFCFLMAGAFDWWAGMLGLSAVLARSLA